MPPTPSGLSLVERCDYHLDFLGYNSRYSDKVREYHYRALKDMITKYLISREDWSPLELDHIKKPWSTTIYALLFRNTKIQLSLNADDLAKLRQRLAHKPHVRKFITKDDVNKSLSLPY